MPERLTEREQHINDLAYRIGALEYIVPELLRLIQSRDGWDQYDKITIKAAKRIMKEARPIQS